MGIEFSETPPHFKASWSTEYRVLADETTFACNLFCRLLFSSWSSFLTHFGTFSREATRPVDITSLLCYEFPSGGRTQGSPVNHKSLVAINRAYPAQVVRRAEKESLRLGKSISPQVSNRVLPALRRFKKIRRP